MPEMMKPTDFFSGWCLVYTYLPLVGNILLMMMVNTNG